MKTKNMDNAVREKRKNFFTKVMETRIWQKIFVCRIDFNKAEELKREAQIKYGTMRF